MSKQIDRKTAQALIAAETILQGMGQAGEYVWLLAKDKPLSERLPYLKRSIKALRHRMTQGGRSRWAEIPVDVKTFIESPLLLNMGDEVYDKIKDEIEQICSGKYVEAIFTGGIGSGKTTAALIVTAYGLYELSCMANPQKTFGLARSSEISFVFQAINKDRSKEVSYSRFREMIDDSPYFETVFPYDRELKSEMKFPQNIRAKPVSGDPKAAIGENVIGGVVDEINFMEKTEKSKQSADGGTFDQAKAIYDSIARRRESRFMIGGVLYGMLCCVSSKRYPGEFTDQKIEESKTNPAIYIYDKRVWEVKPDSASGSWMYLFTGTLSEMPRILDPEEVRDFMETRPQLVMAIPEEHRKNFDQDLLGAVRDIAGVSTLAQHPFIVHADKVAACFGKVPSVLSRTTANLTTETVEFFPKRVENKDMPRWAHIDLGLTGDSAGVAVGHCPGFKRVERFDSVEVMPRIRYDFVLEVPPPRNGEIEFEMIRRLLYNVRAAGLPIKWVSFDSFQSRDSIQIMAHKGFKTGLSSMDSTSLPYDVLKQAFYDSRVEMHTHEKAQMEIVRLEQDPVTGKIDHPPDWSKDCADAMAGVAYGLTMRKQIWSMHGVSLREAPDHLTRQMKEEAA